MGVRFAAKVSVLLYVAALPLALVCCDGAVLDPVESLVDDDDQGGGDDDDTGVADDDDDVADDDAADDDTVADDDDDDDDDAADDDACDDDDTVSIWRGWQGATVGDADASFIGEAPLDWAGCHLEAPGDLDGDGIEDFTIGARQNDEGGSNAGKLYLLFGDPGGWAIDTPLSTLPSVVGDFEDLEIGRAIGAGDVNNDGLADLFLRPGHDSADGLDHQHLLAGRVSGWTPSMPLTTADAWTTDTNQAVGETGLYTERAVGDVNGDGMDDWLLASHWTLNQQGQGVIISGAAATGHLNVPADALGWVYGNPAENISVTPLGDVDGDGMADIASYPLGGPWSYDYIDILLGRTTGYPHDVLLDSVADHRYEVAPGCGLIDYNLVGDLNADGYEDFAVNVRSDHGLPCAGIHLYFGGPGWPAILDVSNADVHLGPGMETHLSEPIGDINGDGIDDMAFGGPGNNPDEHTDVYVILGHGGAWPAQVTTADADVRIRPTPPLDSIWLHGGSGYPAGGIDPKYRGDLDGDGIEDLIVTSWTADYGGVPNAGVLLVFAGRPCWPAQLESADAEGTLIGDVQWQQLGYQDYMGVADVNGDAMDDLLFSSYYHPVGTQEGQVFLFYGHARMP